MVIHPDNGLYRSTYLPAAFPGVLDPSYRFPMKNKRDIDFTFQWILSAKLLCEEKGARFSMVIVPAGFDVDDRMMAMWMPLANMRLIFQSKQLEVEQLVVRCEKFNVEIISLSGNLFLIGNQRFQI